MKIGCSTIFIVEEDFLTANIEERAKLLEELILDIILQSEDIQNN